ncbi:MAG: HD domain-containing protein [Muribaculaceae bacterium]|nr:HD domain-containing protein [Muribaculaceae bacterium]
MAETDSRTKTAEKDYSEEIERRAQEIFDFMAPRIGENDLKRLREAFEFAREAHQPQKRKSGEPYIFHPIAVARIVAEELMLDVDTVIAAFLHDVVEDTPRTLSEVQSKFGPEVAFIVRAVTKPKKNKYEMSKQLDNFKHMLNSLQHDIRPLLLKIADRLHNMRTLSSMRADKQMKIAGETDYFYAPLATRLGLYNVKTELENLSFRFRCPHEYEELVQMIEHDKQANASRLKVFTDEIYSILTSHGIKVRVYVDYREPYSLWRKMQKYGDDFHHLKYRHFIEIVFRGEEGYNEKETALRIYQFLTDRFKEKPGGISNYIDSPKENGYQSFHLKLLADFGKWQEVHISSEEMLRNSQLGLTADRNRSNIRHWLDRFKASLKEIARDNHAGGSFIENVVMAFYNDDIMVFTPQGKPVNMPQRATAIDFAFEIHTNLGIHAKYARINGRLASIKTKLNRGDIVEIYTDSNAHPHADWLHHCVTYKARKHIQAWLSRQPQPEYRRCPVCHPIPGEEVVGFREQNGDITVHKRSCVEVIRLASQWGDEIRSVDFKEDDTLYPVEVEIKCVDRPHMLIDIVDSISNQLNLSIGTIVTETHDAIVTIRLSFAVHSFEELQAILSHIRAIPDVDEVKLVM